MPFSPMTCERHTYEYTDCRPVSQTTLKWRLHNFPTWQTSESITSNIFKFNSIDWYILLETEYNPETKIGYQGISVKSVNCQEELMVRVKVYLKDLSNNDLFLKTKWAKFSTDHDSCEWPQWFSLHHFQENREVLYPEDVFTVYCEVGILLRSRRKHTLWGLVQDLKGAYPAGWTRPKNRSKDSRSILSTDFQNMVVSPKFSDVTLRGHGENFIAHKVVLAAHSLRFCDVLEGTSVLDIRDIPNWIAGDFLQFLYTGRVSKVSLVKAQYLLKTAEDYGVDDLTRSCADYLSHCVSIRSLVYSIRFVERFSHAPLLKAIEKFFVQNYTDLLSDKGWIQLVVEKQTIAIGLKEFARNSLRSQPS